jgi:hypothetical protein
MTFLNQIFYSCNKFDTIHHIGKLQPYMLTKTHHTKIIDIYNESVKSLPVTPVVLEASISPCPEPEPQPSPSTSIEPSPSIQSIHHSAPRKTQSTLFYPQKKNSLFWCMFIHVYGYDEFHLIGSRYQNKELDEKQKMIKFIKENPQRIKGCNHKVTNVMIQDLMAGLLTHRISPLHDCIVYSMFYNKTIYVVKNSMYICYRNKELDTTQDSLENTVILYCKNGKKDNEYGIEMDVTAGKIEDIISNHIQIFNIEKPLKSMSEYKMPDLEKMAILLGIAMGKKKDMYDSIMEKCNWEL